MTSGKTNNSPQKTLSRMIHNGYNFDNLPQSEIDLFMPKIREHKSKCKKCLAEKSDVDLLLGFLDDTKSVLSSMTPEPIKESGLEQLMKESVNEMKLNLKNLDPKKDKEKLKELNGISKLLEIFA